MSDQAQIPGDDLNHEPDGLYEPTLPELAEGAAEAIRSLTHRTMAQNDLEYPADVYEVVASLMIMAQRMPQLFAQLTAWLEREYAAGKITHDSGQIAAEQVREVTGALTLASMEATALADALNTAHNASSGLKATSTTRARVCSDHLVIDCPDCP
jgi:hypothetical protein